MSNDWIVVVKTEPDKWGKLEAEYLTDGAPFPWIMADTMAEAARMPLEDAKRIAGKIIPAYGKRACYVRVVARKETK